MIEIFSIEYDAAQAKIAEAKALHLIPQKAQYSRGPWDAAVIQGSGKGAFLIVLFNPFVDAAIMRSDSLARKRSLMLYFSDGRKAYDQFSDSVKRIKSGDAPWF
jgi:hypothetical protein